MSSELVLQGDLESTSLPDLLRTLYHDKETGVLSMSCDGVTKKLFLKKGQIVFATSTHPDDRLGEYLLRRGILTVAQYIESGRRISPEKKQGAVLCELGHIAAEELPELVRLQVLHIIMGLFQWTRGGYAVEFADALTPDTLLLNFNTADLIMRGIKQIHSWQRISTAVGPPTAVLARVPDTEVSAYRLTLKEEETHLLSLVGEGTTVADICAMSYRNNFETYRLLWGFLSIGLIRCVAEARVPRIEEDERIESLVNLYNQMFAVVYETLFQGAGERAEDLLAQAIQDVSPQYPELFRNVYFDASGRVDVNQFHQNLFTCVTAQRHMLAMAALNELLYNLIFVVKREMGGEAEKQLALRIGAFKQRAMG